MKKVCVLGDGAWGTAIATVLADNGYTVSLWCHNADVARSINEDSCNTMYLPRVTLDTSRIHATTDLAQALADTDWIFQAIPVVFLRSVIEKARAHAQVHQTWVILSKGIESTTQYLPSQVVDDVLGYAVRKAVVTGPSFAKELVQRQLTAVTIASYEDTIAHDVQTLLNNTYFRTFISTDVIGVQLVGALKNCYALAIGILDGAGYGDNTKTFFLTRALHEMNMICVALGGQTATVYDLAGVGDLILTAMGGHSKNVVVGRMVGAGKTLQEVQHALPTLPEGINTLASVKQLASDNTIVLPLLAAVHDVIINQHSPCHLLYALKED